jgi:hypothetical protein
MRDYLNINLISTMSAVCVTEHSGVSGTCCCRYHHGTLPIPPVFSDGPLQILWVLWFDYEMSPEAYVLHTVFSAGFAIWGSCGYTRRQALIEEVCPRGAFEGYTWFWGPFLTLLPVCHELKKLLCHALFPPGWSAKIGADKHRPNLLKQWAE